VLAGHGQHGRQEYGSMDSSILTLTKQRATLCVDTMASSLPKSRDVHVVISLTTSGWFTNNICVFPRENTNTFTCLKSH
jgi:hypothetical protein